MNFTALFRGWGKKATQPTTHRPQLLALEDRESPGGLLSGLATGAFLDGTPPVLDVLGRLDSPAISHPTFRTGPGMGAGDAHRADGQDQVNNEAHTGTRRIGDTVVGVGGTGGLGGVGQELAAPTDLRYEVVLSQSGSDFRNVQLSWRLTAGSFPRHFNITRLCDGLNSVPRSWQIDYPNLAFTDVDVHTGQSCHYGVQSANAHGVSPTAFVDVNIPA